MRLFHVKQWGGINVVSRPEDQPKDMEGMYRHIDGLVRGVTVYSNGAAIVSRSGVAGKSSGGGKRGMITHLSTKARARLLFVAMATSVEFNSMITLTYPREFPANGQMVKGHLHGFLVYYKRRYAGSYLWFLEFQKRGAPHFHLLVTRNNVFGPDRRWLAECWAKVIGLGEERRYCSLLDRRTHDMRMQVLRVNTHPSVWEQVRSAQGARRYVAKYATKTIQKDVPERYKQVGRFYGYSRDVKDRVEPLGSFTAEAEGIRQLLLQEGHKVSEWDFLPKYLFGVECFEDLTNAL